MGLVIGVNRGSWAASVILKLVSCPRWSLSVMQFSGLASHNSLSAGARVSKEHGNNVSLEAC